MTRDAPLYTVSLQDEDWGLIRVGLGTLPHDQVADLISRIGRQLLKQHEAPPPGAPTGAED